MINTKGCLIAIIFIITGLKFVNAQEKLSFGLSTQIQNTKLLVNASSLIVKGAYRPTSILFTEYNFWRKMSIHTGIGYTMMTQNSDAFKNDFHYLAMPLYLKHGKMKDNKKLAFKSFYGANFHYLLNANHTYLNGEKVNIMEHCRQFHWELVVGGGLKYRLSDNLSLEALTSFSIGYMLTKFNPAYMDVHNINTGFMLNLSYKIK
jgi:hypothetical protein